MLVCILHPINIMVLNWPNCVAGGWTKSHPLPADKGRFGQFNLLAQKNQHVIQQILESDFVPAFTSPTLSYDEQILKKLRSLYSSCMDEENLDKLGEDPLVRFVQTIRDLFRGKSTEIGVAGIGEGEKKKKGLTAAISFMHSRGEHVASVFHDYNFTEYLSSQALTRSSRLMWKEILVWTRMR